MMIGGQRPSATVSRTLNLPAARGRTAVRRSAHGLLAQSAPRICHDGHTCRYTTVHGLPSSSTVERPTLGHMPTLFSSLEQTLVLARLLPCSSPPPNLSQKSLCPLLFSAMCTNLQRPYDPSDLRTDTFLGGERASLMALRFDFEHEACSRRALVFTSPRCRPCAALCWVH